jgi:hypothetical protein
VFQVNNLRPCSTVSLHLALHITTHLDDGDELDAYHIYDVCIKPLDNRSGKYVLHIADFNDDDTPHVWHRLNKVHGTKALHYFLKTIHGHPFA